MTNPPPVTRELAGFAAALDYDRLPAGVAGLMPLLLVDLFRAAAAGRSMPWVAKAGPVFEALGGIETSSIFFTPRKADAQRAAYMNGVIAGSLDWDDSHAGALIHPGVVIWPAALAVAEMTGADGKKLIAAVAAGYEVAIRIGLSIQLSHSLRGFQGTPTCGVFGAATAAGKLLGLDAKGLTDTLGLAASYASGLSQFFVSGSDVKRIHAGKAAAQGVEAALLARAGVSGPHDAIEGAQGFGQAASDAYNPEASLAGLGQNFETGGVLLKVHAGTARLQAAVEAAEILARRGVRPQDVETVSIGVHPAAIGKLSFNAPVDQQQAQLSAPFAVALGLTLAQSRPAPLILGIADFAQGVGTSAIRELSGRITCVVDDEIAAATTRTTVPARLVATLKDGRTEEATVMTPKGSVGNPMTAEEIIARFRQTVSGIVPEPKAEAWLAGIADLPALPAIAELFAGLMPETN